MDVLSLCPTFRCPTYCNPPGSSGRGISQARNWAGMPFSSPGDLPDPEIKPESLASPTCRQVPYQLRLLSESSQKEIEPPNWNWKSGSPLSNGDAEETLTLSHSNKATLS